MKDTVKATRADHVNKCMARHFYRQRSDERKSDKEGKWWTQT